ncbi:uracil-DNA glycosylase family protein [Salinarchaeum sp. Harcht-Bsk1]|uniref:uracil-DNA glycosylase n=1 Tax=Salinarchaeum sp. Harcht-Bsk1 TaxID=1333523 RepID=UPI00067815E5|nr:uracil-DNA glycosylase [Salinarchaeum sp. Harcht-Bsk1]
MDANQEDLSNPFGMDEDCENCPGLVEPRSQVVHGYGDVGGDFLFVGERPDAGADESGVPFTNGPAGERLLGILRRCGLCGSPVDSTEPELANVYLTNLTRCRHPERPPTDEEITNCEPFLNAEIRMINPEILVPVGERALEWLVEDYTTTDPDDVSLPDAHGERLRGRGFELVPMVDPATMTDEQADDFVHDFSALMATDYRQTKGRRSR